MGGDALICSSRFDICHRFPFPLPLQHIRHTLSLVSFSSAFSFYKCIFFCLSFFSSLTSPRPFLLLLQVSTPRYHYYVKSSLLETTIKREGKGRPLQLTKVEREGAGW